MKRIIKRLPPIFLGLVVICSIVWYLLVYDRGFTQDILLSSARFFESHGNQSIATWLYNQAYFQSGNDNDVIIELANRFKHLGNYTQAEVTLSNAIAENGSADLYIALCKTYVEQDKLLDAANMLENVTNPDIKAQLDALRPKTPVASPAPGFYNQYIDVQIRSESPGKLYVSMNGDFPSLENLLNEDITLVGGENKLYAVAVGENGLVSTPAYFGYTVGGVIEKVTISDPVLDSLFRSQLNVSADTQLYTNDLWKITALTVPEGVTDYSDLGRLSYLENLTMENHNPDNLLSLSSLTQLKELVIRNCPLSAADLTTIGNLPNLEKLTLSGCSLSNISGLSNASNLTYLDLSRNAIRDLTPLAFMEKLSMLDLNNNALTNLSPLSALESLTVLDVSYNSIVSIAPLAPCTALTGLVINNNQITEIPVFDNPSVLTVLTASNNSLTNVDSLSRYTSLTGLDLSHNQITDISSLASLEKLTAVDFSYNKITKLPKFGSMLVVLEGAHNKISSVTPLRSLPLLNKVILDYNKISNIDALAECPLLTQVDVFGNPVRDVSKLTQYSIIVNYDPT